MIFQFEYSAPENVNVKGAFSGSPKASISLQRDPMQRLYGGTWMGNRDGSRGGARLEYPGPLAEGGGESMSVEENLKVIEAATKALNDRDFDRFEGLHLNSVLQRDPQNPEGIKGFKAFPDIRFVPETQFGAGDWITQLSHIRGTNTGPLVMPGSQTIPATNKAVRLPVAMVAKLEGGKFAEINVYFD